MVSIEIHASAGFMAPLHAHEADEVVEVVAGGMTVFAGGDSICLRAADAFIVAKGVRHTFRAEASGTRAAFTTLTHSAGSYEAFLRASGPVAHDSSGSPAWATDEDEAAVRAIAHAANVVVIGPPGMLSADAELAARAA